MALPGGVAGLSLPQVDDCPQTASSAPVGVAALRRNGWPAWTGFSGWFASESPAGFPRNTHDVAGVSSQGGRRVAARAAGERAAAEREDRQVDPWKLRRWRLHDHRHAFAIAALLDGADIYDL